MFTRVPATMQQVLVNGASATTGWGWKEAAPPRGSGLGNIWDQASGGVQFTHRRCWEQHRRTWGAIPFTGWPLARPVSGWDLDWGFRGGSTARQQAAGCNGRAKVTPAGGPLCPLTPSFSCWAPWGRGPASAMVRRPLPHLGPRALTSL